jgi:hypothetical protein
VFAVNGKNEAEAVYDRKGRVIGIKKGEVLELQKNKFKHLYRRKNAWCINCHVFIDHPDIKFVRIEEVGANGKAMGIAYMVSTEFLMEEAVCINFKGHAMQYALPLEKWGRVTNL